MEHSVHCTTRNRSLRKFCRCFTCLNFLLYMRKVFFFLSLYQSTFSYLKNKIFQYYGTYCKQHKNTEIIQLNDLKNLSPILTHFLLWNRENFGLCHSDFMAIFKCEIRIYIIWQYCFCFQKRTCAKHVYNMYIIRFLSCDFFHKSEFLLTFRKQG